MKRAVIIHCWGGKPNYCWYPNTKKELEDKGYEVAVPEMPDTDYPKFDKWFSKLKEVIGDPDENLYLIGHSLGCITILRYLESLKEGEKIGGAVLVAGFAGGIDIEEIESFINKPVDFKKIKSHCKNFIAIHSDNDPFVPLKHGDILKEKLGAKLIIKNNMKHFSGEIDKEENCIELPDVVENLLEISK
ncbi:MAG TPA: serine hydrolase family protein [Candidatus Wolfebacteria bacterium]|nr:serine hydrolase family protein [Candidatus Wolfebacteria bacterium]